MKNFLATLVGKFVAAALSFRPRGGQALPGLIVERLFPNYVPSMLSKLPEGVVVVTGTNGKTTTTKILTQILEANGKRVLTNPTGSNLIRGIASSISQRASYFGKLNYDLAVLEVDEATVSLLTEKVRPNWVLALNVSRDQLDRYGEIDHVAKRIGKAMKAAKIGVVTNAGDPSLVAQAKAATAKTAYFGVSVGLRKSFPSDYELASVDAMPKASHQPSASVELESFKGQSVTYNIDGQEYQANLFLSGQHNFLNGAAALALSVQLLPNVSPDILVAELARVPLAFGRGETYRLKNGETIELVLVKNPASFTQALASYGESNASFAIAINDNIADGRDVSWLWDVNLKALGKNKVELTSGTRAADMALRLGYDSIKVPKVEADLGKALELLSSKGGRKIFLATYTAMLKLHGILSEKAEKL